MATLVLKGSVEEKELILNLCFHTITSEQISLTTDITDHIVEDHTIIQDHITVKPVTYTMRGLIAEKFYEHPDTVTSTIPGTPLSIKLAPLKILAPVVNSYVQSAINAYESVRYKVNQFYPNMFNNIKSFNQYFKLHRSSTMFPQNTQPYDQTHTRWAKNRLQKEIIDLLNNFRINRIPVSVDTGWDIGLKDNFYITEISVNQGETYQESDISVTIKQLRFTDTKLVELTSEEAGRLQQQNALSQTTIVGTKDGELKSEAYKASGRE